VFADVAFYFTLAENLALFITKRSCVPLLVTSTPSYASTLKTKLPWVKTLSQGSLENISTYYVGNTQLSTTFHRSDEGFAFPRW